MGLRDQINDDLKAAMRGGDVARRDTIRLLTAALKQREVDERKTLTDADVLGVIEKMIKQRRDSIAQFEQGGRQDLADREKQELVLLQAYMPQAMGDD
ncbi:MAG: GatB/YqeY domain-containing protein, partial [Burkholderiales bacterium]|nr:GatB/YqeY domain-containing protein [Burkholderiales bacterium]